MADRKSLLFSAVLLMTAIVVIVVATLFHPGNPLSPCVCVTPTDVFTAYANSTNWTLVHEYQFVGSAISIFGLLALFFGLNVASGIRGMLNRFAAASAVVALALDGAVYAGTGSLSSRPSMPG